MTHPDASPPLPDGVRPHHIHPKWLFGHHASPLSLLILGIVVALGLSGLAGGGPRTEQSERNARGTFTLLAPTISRNGDIIESRFRVEAAKPIDKLVIGVEPSLWAQITTNSTVPQASEEKFEGGMLRFAFDRVDAGGSFEYQVAQQINPDLVGSNRGRVVFYDGNTPLAEFSARLRVLP